MSETTEKIAIPQAQLEAIKQTGSASQDEISQFVAIEEMQDNTETVETEPEVIDEEIAEEEVIEEEEVDEEVEVEDEVVDEEPETTEVAIEDDDVEEEFDEGLKRKKVNGKWHYAVYPEKGGEPEWVDARVFRRNTSQTAYLTRKFQELSAKEKELEAKLAANNDLADIMNLIAPQSVKKEESLDDLLDLDSGKEKPSDDPRIAKIEAKLKQEEEKRAQIERQHMLRAKVNQTAMQVNSLLESVGLEPPSDNWEAVGNDILMEVDGDAAKWYEKATDPNYLVKKYKEIYPQNTKTDSQPEKETSAKKPPKKMPVTRVKRKSKTQSDLTTLTKEKESIQGKLNNPKAIISYDQEAELTARLQEINMKLKQLNKGQ